MFGTSQGLNAIGSSTCRENACGRNWRRWPSRNREDWKRGDWWGFAPPKINMILAFQFNAFQRCTVFPIQGWWISHCHVSFRWCIGRAVLLNIKVSYSSLWCWSDFGGYLGNYCVCLDQKQSPKKSRPTWRIGLWNRTTIQIYFFFSKNSPYTIIHHYLLSF